MPTLRRAVTIGGPYQELVALQHDDMLEKPGERPGRRQTAHAGTDHNGLLANHSLRHPAAERPRPSRRCGQLPSRLGLRIANLLEAIGRFCPLADLRRCP